MVDESAHLDGEWRGSADAAFQYRDDQAVMSLASKIYMGKDCEGFTGMAGKSIGR